MSCTGRPLGFIIWTWFSVVSLRMMSMNQLLPTCFIKAGLYSNRHEIDFLNELTLVKICLEFAMLHNKYTRILIGVESSHFCYLAMTKYLFQGVGKHKQSHIPSIHSKSFPDNVQTHQQICSKRLEPWLLSLMRGYQMSLTGP